MRTSSHVIYLSLLALISAAWLYERTELDDNSAFPSLMQEIPNSVQPDHTSYIASHVKDAAIEPGSGQHSDVLTETGGATPEIPPEAYHSVQVQQLLAKRMADKSAEFDRQDYHPDWSFERRQLVSDLFVVHAKELENFDVVDIDCKRSVCRIQSEIAGEHFMQIMELQRVLNQQEWFGPSGETVFTANENGQPHEIYLSFGN